MRLAMNRVQGAHANVQRAVPLVHSKSMILNYVHRVQLSPIYARGQTASAKHDGTPAHIASLHTVHVERNQSHAVHNAHKNARSCLHRRRLPAHARIARARESLPPFIF